MFGKFSGVQTTPDQKIVDWSTKTWSVHCLQDPCGGRRSAKGCRVYTSTSLADLQPVNLRCDCICDQSNLSGARGLKKTSQSCLYKRLQGTTRKLKISKLALYQGLYPQHLPCWAAPVAPEVSESAPSPGSGRRSRRPPGPRPSSADWMMGWLMSG